MARGGIEKLTSIEVKNAKSGLLSDGGRLYLRVTSPTQKSWVYIFPWAGKSKEMGLGSLQDVGLADARKLRAAQTTLLMAGINPIAERDRLRAEARVLAAPKAAGMTLKDASNIVLELAGPKARTGRVAWVRMTQAHVGALAAKAVCDITTDDVVAALEPFWLCKPETADRMRMRLEKILGWAKVKGHIPDPWTNPARWESHLEFLLPQRKRVTVNHPSLPYKKAGAFMADLRAEEASMGALAAEWIILTAVRNSEGRLAQWPEIDRARRIWTVPAERMKMKKEHRVPLSDAAMAFLDRLGQFGAAQSEFLFPSPSKPGSAISVATPIKAVLKHVETGEADVHGFRGTFKGWSLRVSGFADAERLGEECLAHVVGNKVRNAYLHDDGVEERRAMMQAWGEFLGAAWVENVEPLNVSVPAARAA